MNSKIYTILILVVLLNSCGSSDIKDFIEDKIEDSNGVVNNDGNITEGLEENISVTAEIQDALDAHNNARATVGINKELTWDTKITQDAQSYADEIAQSGFWGHDSKNHGRYANGNYGENLYTSTQKPTLKIASDAWIDERQYYTFGNFNDNSTCQEDQICGHYTQVIWKDTSKMGCAMSKYKTGNFKNWYVIVCKYQTPGNIIGKKPY